MPGQPDTIAAHELVLYGTNTGQLYPMRQRIEEQLRKKAKKGTYQHSRAWKAWMYFADASAKSYTKEFGKMPGQTAFGSFDKPTRELAARQWADDFAEKEGFPRKEANLPTREKKTKK